MAAALLACLASASGQERHKLVINAETVEGKLLQGIGQESDEPKKLALMEQFLAQYPAHEGAGWVLMQAQPAYAKAGQYDKVIATGEKLIAMDAGDLDAAYPALKAAEAKKDPAAILKWSATVSDIARKIAKSQQPADADQVEAWKQRVDYAKQVDTYTEYAVFASAVANPEPAKTIAAYEALEKRSPASPYVKQLTSGYIVAISQSAADKVVPVAERLLTADPANDDLLLILADAYTNKQQNDKALDASAKLIEVLKTKPKPENLAEADWQNKKNQSLGRAYWYSGVIYSSQEKWPAADQSLRASLPLIKGNAGMEGPAYFYLGLANYRMGKGKSKAQMADALKFSEMSAAIKGPFQPKAAQNVKAIREGK